MWRMPGRVRGRGPGAALAPRRLELGQLDPSVAVRGLQHRDLRLHALEADDAVHPLPLHRRPALTLEAQLDEEVDRGREVVDHDPDVFHPLDRHRPDRTGFRKSIEGCG